MNSEAAMVACIKLAALSQDRQQWLPRDKFLILAGVAAVEAGSRPVAEQCRTLVLSHNPQHLIGSHSSFAAALENPDFQAFAKQLSRFCSYEQAEHLLTQNNLSAGRPAEGISWDDYALLLLHRMDLRQPT